MAVIIVLVIILICAACLYLKGSTVLGLASIIAALCAGFIAFSYFESVAAIFIKKNSMPTVAHTVSFLLLFVLPFLIFEVIIIQITREGIDLGFIAERIGRVICGIFLGLIVSGYLLVALSMAPLSHKAPYQRFDQTKPDVENPSKGPLNADGFVTGWFSIASNGSLSAKKCFASLHPDFLDEAFLNRLKVKDRVPNVTKIGNRAMEVPRKIAIWPAPEDVKNADDPNEIIDPKPGHNLTIVRLGITRSGINRDGRFMTLSQLRIICKQQDEADKPFSGKSRNVYPIGYMKTAGQLQLKNLGEPIETSLPEKKKRNKTNIEVKWIDFVFDVPNGYVPVLAGFRQNVILELPKPVTADKAPEIIPFEIEETTKKKDNTTDK